MFEGVGAWIIVVGGGLGLSRITREAFEPILPPTGIKRRKSIIPVARANLYPSDPGEVEGDA